MAMIYTDIQDCTCPGCGQDRSIYYDEVFGFYKCENCSTMWGFDRDDPDYDDDLLQELEAKQIAETLLEADLETFG